MRLLLFALLFLQAISTFAQNKLDSNLITQIKIMYREDQKWRKEFIKAQSKKSEYSEETIGRNETTADSLNYFEAKKIVAKYGFPGYNLVEESGSMRFWAIIQHCDNDVPFQQKVLKLMFKQVKHKNASAENYAYLKDRVLIGTKKKQLYGTQYKFNPQTKHCTPLPIQDPVNVDKRRAEMNMTSLADYMKEAEKILN